MNPAFSFRWTLFDCIVAGVVLWFLLRKQDSAVASGQGTVIAPNSGDPGYFNANNPTGFNPYSYGQ